MSFDEKRAWIQAVVSSLGYGIYCAIVLSRADHQPLADVPYVAVLLATVGGAIVVSIVTSIAWGIFSRGDTRQDQRDREIHRFGEYIGQSMLVVGAVAAMLLAMAEVQYFWIANTIYLGFVLSALLGSVAKIVAYRRGLP